MAISAPSVHRILAAAVRLAADSATGDRHPIWIQAATEGTYKGHPANPKIELSKELFDEVIANFRANPSYRAGEDGVGTKAVVRLDYEHLSEMSPLDIVGAAGAGIPAPGFVMELEQRDGSGPNEGAIELWALVEPTEQLWSQIQNGEYKWTSVAIDPKGKDRVTGKVIGAVLTSLAITNNPFILGMEEMSTDSVRSGSVPIEKVAASSSLNCGFLLMNQTKGRGKTARTERIYCAMDLWGAAETPEEALVGLRSMFNLAPEATAIDVLAELNVFAEMVANDSVPKHVEVDSLIYRLRTMFSIKVLAGATEVIEAAKAVLAGLIEKNAAGEGSPLSAPQSPPATSLSAPEKPTMKTLAQRLAPHFNLSADASDDDVVDAVKSAAAQSAGLKGRLLKVKKLKLAATDDEDKILEAVEGVAEGAESGAEAANAIEKLLQILGGEDITDTLAKATKLTEQVSKHSSVVEQLNALKAQLTDSEVEKAEDEIAAIAACHKMDDRTKVLLTLQVFSVTKDAAGKETKSVNADGLAAIRKTFPLTEGQTVRTLLTSGLFAGPAGVQLGGPSTGLVGGNAPVQAAPAASTELKTVQEKILACAGDNNTLKAMAYLEEHEAVKFSAVSEDRRPFVAGHYFRTGKLVA